MILGIGTDVVYINRIEAVYNKFGYDFARKILTRREFDHFIVSEEQFHSSVEDKRFKGGQKSFKGNRAQFVCQSEHRLIKPKIRKYHHNSAFDYAEEKNLANIRAIRFLAKRFAAKEAVLKAFGTGITPDCGFLDIEIFNDQLGKPFVTLSDHALKVLSKRFDRKRFSIFITISDEMDIALAFAILES